MNKRIQQLAGQALDQAVPQTWTTLTAYDLTKFTEKFADLIVYECIDLALGSSHREDDMGAIIANKIKKHFGIEL